MFLRLILPGRRSEFIIRSLVVLRSKVEGDYYCIAWNSGLYLVRNYKWYDDL